MIKIDENYILVMKGDMNLINIHNNEAIIVPECPVMRFNDLIKIQNTDIYCGITRFSKIVIFRLVIKDSI